MNKSYSFNHFYLNIMRPIYKNTLIIIFCIFCSSKAFASGINFNDTTSQVAPINSPSFVGNVGIGTFVQLSTLSVNGGVGIGTTSISTAYINNSAPPGGLTVQGNVGIGTFNPFGGSLIVTNNGNVGLGTLNPGAELEVWGHGLNSGDNNTILRLTNSNLGSSDGLVFTEAGNFDNGYLGIFGPFGSYYIPNETALYIMGERFEMPVIFGTTGSENMRLDYLGNVGIGTVTAFSKVDLVGGIGIGTSKNSSFITTAAPIGGMIVQNNVGIGSVTPGQALDVQGTARMTGFTLTGNGAGATKVLTSDANGNGTWQAAGAGSNYWTLDTGNIGINTTNNIGIGTIAAVNKLNVLGNIGIGTFSYDPYMLTTASNGGLIMAGNLGIGTWAPQDALVIAGGTVVSSSGVLYAPIVEGGGAEFINGGNPTAFVVTIGGLPSDAALQLWGDGSTNANFDAINGSGNLGLGTTTSINNALVVNGAVGIGTANSAYVINAAPSGGMIVQNNVGIGSLTPGQALDVQGTARMTGFTLTGNGAGAGKVLTSDANGDGTWGAAAGSNYWLLNGGAGNIGINTSYAVGIGTSFTGGTGEAVLSVMNGNVGIGTWKPGNSLDIVNGNIGIGTFYNLVGIGTTSTILSLRNDTTSIYVGWQAGASTTVGNLSNVAVGNGTLMRNAGGGGNTAVGVNALNANTTSIDNSAFGISALLSNTTGLNNSAVGSSALPFNLSGQNNTALGYTSGFNTVAGSDNVWLGANSGSFSDVSNSVGIGSFARAGANNVMVLGGMGVNALNVGIGTSMSGASGSLIVVASGNSTGNVGIGSVTPGQALDVNGTARMTGFTLTGNGAGAGKVLTSDANGDGTWGVAGAGSNYWLLDSGNVGINTAYAVGIGTISQVNKLNILGNIGIGTFGYDPYMTLAAPKGGMIVEGNVGIGTWAPSNNLELPGNIGINTTTSFIGIGTNSTILTNRGDSLSIYLGWQAGASTTAGNLFNSAVGYQALTSDTTGSFNTAMGYIALSSNSTGGGNSAFGHLTLGSNSTGSDNNAFGEHSLNFNQTGSNNTALGSYALFGNFSGYDNVAVGFDAGEPLGNAGTVAGSNNVFLGANSGDIPGEDWNNSVGIGSLALAGANNVMVLGGTGVNALNVGIGTNMSGASGSLIVMASGNSSGNVGLGTLSPGAVLDVNGTVRATAFEELGTSAGPNDTSLGLTTGGGTISANIQGGALAGGNAFLVGGASASILSDGPGSFAYGEVLGTAGSSSMTSSGTGSIAMGVVDNGTMLSDSGGSIAMGNVLNGTMISNNSGSIAMGLASAGTLQATGGGSVAIGDNVQANASSAFALGLSVVNPNANSFMVGFNATPTLTVTGTGVGIGTSSPFGGGLIVLPVNTGNVGIGSLTPGQALDVQGTSRMTGFTLTGNGAGATKVLTSDANGNGTWQAAGAGSNYWLLNGGVGNIGINTSYAVGIGTSFTGGTGEAALSVMNGNIGIGTWVPGNSLEVKNGNIGIGTFYNLVGIGTTSTILSLRNDIFSVYLGWQSGASTTLGSLSNVAVGSSTLVRNTTGNNNTALGTIDLEFNTSGTGNTAVGSGALVNNTTAVNNTAVGSSSLGNSQTGSNNSALGASSLGIDNSGYNNVAVGYSSGAHTSNGSNNVFLGANASSIAGIDSSNSVGIGSFALVGANNVMVLGGTGAAALNVGIGTNMSGASGSLIVMASGSSPGNVGIGSLTPGQALDVQGTSRMTGFTLTGNGAGATKVLTSDANGNGTWQAAGAGSNYWLLNGGVGNIGINTSYAVGIGTSFTGGANEAALSVMNGNVGIGTWVPGNSFEVTNGNIGISTTETLIGIGTTSTILTMRTDKSSIYVGWLSGASTIGNTLNNAAVGSQALQANTTGNGNSAMGQGALQKNTTGVNNSATGFDALFSNIGADNSAMGVAALGLNTTGIGNSAMGMDALQNNSSGSSNSAMGLSALQSNTSGSFNSAMGQQALAANGTGYSNTAFGLNAGWPGGANGTVAGANNVWIGVNSGPSGTSDVSNSVGIGSFALAGTSNVMVLGGMGVNSLNVGIGTDMNGAKGSLIVLGNNVGIGSVLPGQALDVQGTARMTGFTLTGNGAGATKVLTSDANGNGTWQAAGAGSNYWLLNGGAGNIGINTSYAVGIGTSFTGGANEAALSVMNGNVGIGTWKPGNSLEIVGGNIGISTAYNLVGIGTTFTILTMRNDTTSIYAGWQAGASTTAGGLENVAVGNLALLYNTTGSNNIAMGNEALRLNTTGSSNVALGFWALNDIGLGSNNVAVGSQALEWLINTPYSDNTALGYEAGYNNSQSGVLTSASQSTFLGDSTEALVNSDANETVIGYGAIGNGSNTVTLGNTSVVKTILEGNIGIGTWLPVNQLVVNGAVGIGTANSAYVTTIAPAGGMIVQGNVGIGSLTPGQALDVQGTARMTGFTLTGNGAGAGKVLTSDANGDGSWSAASGSNYWLLNGGVGNIGINTSYAVGIGTSFTGGANEAALSVMNGNVGIGTWIPKSILYLSGGTLGIGTANPAESIDVNGNMVVGTRISGGVMQASTGSFAGGNELSGAANITASGGGSFAFGLSNNNSIIASGAGSVAMGDGTNQNVQATGTGSISMGQGTQANASNNLAFGLNIINNLASTFMVGFNVTPTMTVTSNNVGIGTFTPASVLTVNGGLGIGTTLTNSAYVGFNSAPSGGLIVQGNVGIGTFNPFGGQLIVSTTNGNVGIGSLTPGQALDVQGTARMTGFTLTGNGAGAGKVLTSDANGDGTWGAASGSNYWLLDTSNVGLNTTYAIGLGTISATNKLNVLGNIGIGTFGYDQYMTLAAPNGGMIVSGNVGLGTWAPHNNLEIGGVGSIGINTTFNLIGIGTTSTVLTLRGDTTSVYLGWQAGAAFTGTNWGNTAVGNQSLIVSNSGGGANTAVGYQTLKANTSGANNTAVGNTALTTNTTGINNAAFGYQALISNSSGANNTALGANALLDLGVGSYNTAVGVSALNQNQSSNNTAVGASALNANNGGYNNTALGYQAGIPLSTNGTVAGANNVWLGANSGPVGTTDVSNSVGIGSFALAGANNVMVLGGSGVNALNVGIGTFAPQGKLIVAGGNIGIATFSPTSPLQVLGNVGIGTGAINSQSTPYTLNINNTAVFNSEFNNGSSGASLTINWNNGNKQRVLLNNNNCSLTFTAPTGTAMLLLKLVEDGSGGRGVTWPGTVEWTAGTAPSLTASPNAVDIVTCYYDGTNYFCVPSFNFQT